VRLHFCANRGQRLAEIHHPAELGVVAYLAVHRMIPVLLAAASVVTYGLQMPVRRRTDPDARPRRRNGQRFYTLDLSFIANDGSRAVDESEASTRTFAHDAFDRSRDVSK